MLRIVFIVAFLSVPLIGYCEEVQTNDKNKDGKIDGWIYRNDKGAPLRWVRDTNFDGKEDSWSFFKEGKAFLDEDDVNGDGQVDRIIISLFAPENMKSRSISIVRKDPQNNIFIENEDTDWQPTASLQEEHDTLLQKDEGKHSYTPKDGYIPDKTTALTVAEAILVPIYGSAVINKEKPLRAELKDGVWTVEGTMNCPEGQRCVGGVAVIEISKDSGAVLRVSHGQ